MKSIPVDQLKNKTDTGLQIKIFRPDDDLRNEEQRTYAHRDDHYIFFLLTEGSGTLMVDLQNITVSAGQLYYVLPSQIHHKIKPARAGGWFLAVDTSLISPELKDVFESQPNAQVPCGLTAFELQQYTTLFTLLLNEYAKRQNDSFYLPIVHSLVQSFLAMAASTYSAAQNTENRSARSAELVRQFKNVLSANSRTVKSPSAYAEMLNVSPGYLNETIKKITGSTVSYWIQQEVFSEAKRLLYHNDDDIKQIAQKLGYEDYSYFNRIFRKAAGMSPLKFRTVSRKTA